MIFDPFTDTGGGLEMLFRWGHVLSGITWIGLLYFFNFVQTPAYAELSPAARGEAFDKLTWRALWWFRWAAALTFLTGVTILGIQKNLGPDFADYFAGKQGTSIAWGAILGTIMFLNVWGVIWRAQKVVIASERDKLAGGEGDPAQAGAAKKAARASRANTLFSIPMLFFMLFTSHFAIVGNYADPDGGVMVGAWAIFIVIVAFIELSALGLLGGLDNFFNKAAFDKHRNTIIAGFVVWALLFFGGWELIIGEQDTAPVSGDTTPVSVTVAESGG
ncbi:MAG: urate hydroxylase PuuD [Acidimicrobiales bacterium]|nr:urate hydroxylase PuuD [Acidimicrobiales bacterium]MCB9372481.1 urate hydroxylase PuuD [Microthrixaceae bacterium]